jgi:hypothetical protein
MIGNAYGLGSRWQQTWHALSRAGEPGAEIFVTDLERSHHELRAALILAGKEIRKLNFGKWDTPLLRQLRQVLREARLVTRRPTGPAL